MNGDFRSLVFVLNVFVWCSICSVIHNQSVCSRTVISSDKHRHLSMALLFGFLVCACFQLDYITTRIAYSIVSDTPFMSD